MKFKVILCFILLIFIESKSQDYARHLELSLLFYECQRSGPLPKNNRNESNDIYLDYSKSIRR